MKYAVGTRNSFSYLVGSLVYVMVIVKKIAL